MKKSWKFILSLIGTTVISGGVISTCISSCGCKSPSDNSPKSIDIDGTTNRSFDATAFFKGGPTTEHFTPTYEINVSPEEASKEVTYHLEDTKSEQPHNAKIDEETGEITFDTFNEESYRKDPNHSFTLKVYAQSKINKKIKSKSINITVTAKYGQPDTLELIVNGPTERTIKANVGDQMFWTDDKKLTSELSCSKFPDLKPDKSIHFQTNYEIIDLPSKWQNKVVATSDGNIQIKTMNTANQIDLNGSIFKVRALVQGAGAEDIKPVTQDLKLKVNYADPTKVNANYVSSATHFQGYLGQKGVETIQLSSWNVSVSPETANQEVKYEVVNDDSHKIHISEDGSEITWDSVDLVDQQSYPFGVKVSSKANPSISDTVSGFSLTLNKTPPASIYITEDGSLPDSAFFKQGKPLNDLKPLKVGSSSKYDDLTVTWSLIGKNAETIQAIDNEQLLISQVGVISYTNDLPVGNYSYQVKAVAVNGGATGTTNTHTLKITKQPSEDFNLTFDSKTGDTFPVNTDASVDSSFSKFLGRINATPVDSEGKYSYDLEYQVVNNTNNLPITIDADADGMSAAVNVGMIDRIISSPESFQIKVFNKSIPHPTAKFLTFNLTTNRINPTRIDVDTAGTPTKELTLETEGQTLGATFTATPNDPEITYSDVTWSIVMIDESGQPIEKDQPDWLHIDPETGAVSFGSTADLTLLYSPTYFKVKATSTKDSNVSGLSKTCEITYKRPSPTGAVINIPDALYETDNAFQLMAGQLDSEEYWFDGSITGKETSDKSATFSIIPSQGADQDLINAIHIDTNYTSNKKYLKWDSTTKTGTVKFHIRITSNADSSIYQDSSEITFTFKPRYSLSYVPAANEENRLYQVGSLDGCSTSTTSKGAISIYDNFYQNYPYWKDFNWTLKYSDGSIDTHSEVSTLLGTISFENYTEPGVYNLTITATPKDYSSVSIDSSNTVKVKVWGNNWVPYDDLSVDPEKKYIYNMVGGNNNYALDKYKDTQIDTFTVPNNAIGMGAYSLLKSNLNFLFSYLTDFSYEDESICKEIGASMCSPQQAFYNDYGFETVRFPDSLKSIFQWSFANQNIKHIDDFKNVTKIKEFAFSYNTPKNGTNESIGTWTFHSNNPSSLDLEGYFGYDSSSYDTVVITHSWGAFKSNMLNGGQYSKLTTFVLDGYTSKADVDQMWQIWGQPSSDAFYGAKITKLIFRNSNMISLDEAIGILGGLKNIFTETSPFENAVIEVQS